VLYSSFAVLLRKVINLYYDGGDEGAVPVEGVGGHAEVLIDGELSPLPLRHGEPNLPGVHAPVRHQAEDEALAGAGPHLYVRTLLGVEV